MIDWELPIEWTRKVLVSFLYTTEMGQFFCVHSEIIEQDDGLTKTRMLWRMCKAPRKGRIENVYIHEQSKIALVRSYTKENHLNRHFEREPIFFSNFSQNSP